MTASPANDTYLYKGPSGESLTAMGVVDVARAAGLAAPSASGDRLATATGTATLNASYTVNQCMGGKFSIAAGIGNGTPFTISAVEVMLLSPSVTLPSTSTVGLLFVYGARGADLTGTYTDAATLIGTTADMVACARAGAINVLYGTGALYAGAVTSGYKSLGSGVTASDGTLTLALLCTTAAVLTNVAMRVTLTLHY
jgi:hypothetical protein